MKEEPFGPIAPIIPFDSLDEAITKSNSLPYGLAAYVFTQSEKNTGELIESLEAGGIAINSGNDCKYVTLAFINSVIPITSPIEKGTVLFIFD